MFNQFDKFRAAVDFLADFEPVDPQRLDDPLVFGRQIHGVLGGGEEHVHADVPRVPGEAPDFERAVAVMVAVIDALDSFDPPLVERAPEGSRVAPFAESNAARAAEGVSRRARSDRSAISCKCTLGASSRLPPSVVSRRHQTARRSGR